MPHILALLAMLAPVPAFAVQSSVDVRVTQGSDDAEERSTGSVLLGSSDLELVFDRGGDQVVGMRFLEIDIPSGVVVQNAYVQFQADETSNSLTGLTIEGEASDDAAGFIDNTGDVSSRPRTAAGVDWFPAPWVRGENGANQRTPDLSAVVQEILDRPGWNSGNDMVLLVRGSGERVAESYDGDPLTAPLLHIEFDSSFNLPPSVDAGADASVHLPSTMRLLDGTVADDGFTAFLDTQWSHEGGTGAGTATFADASQVDTSVTFSSDPGTYVLRLTADDGEFIVFDELTITLLAIGPATLDTRVPSGFDDAEERSGGKVLLSSSDLELVFDGGGNQTVGMRFAVIVPQGSTIQNAYIQFQVDESSTGATNLTIQGEASDDAAPFVSASGNLSARPRTAAAVAWVPALWPTVGEAGPDQRTPDLSAILQEIVERPGWAGGNDLALFITGSGEHVAEAYDGVPSAAPLLHVEYTSGTPVNQPPSVDAGLPASVTLPEDTVSLDATVTDDGLTGTLSTLWTHSGGTGTGSVSFANATSVDTQASFSAETGTYVLRLTADDGEFVVFDEVTITVLPSGTNAAPMVDAGSAQTVSLSSGAVLDGTVSDDGLPDPPGQVTTTWSLVSGPSTVSFDDEGAVDTTASFGASGTYVLRLSADDSALSATDDVTITVTGSGGTSVAALTQVLYTPTGFVGGNPLTVPSIDPASVTFHPPSGHLFIADSEINEVLPVWTIVQANIFECSLTADTLYDSIDVTSSPSGFSNNKEPTGITYDEVDGHFYVTNDDNRKLFRYAYDGSNLTVVDSVSLQAFTSDPEGISCDSASGRLYIVGGDLVIVVYRYQGGFLFEDSFNLASTAGNSSGVPQDPEGIAFDPISSNLFVVSAPDDRLYEYTTSGTFIQSFDLSGLSPKPISLDGVAIGPSSSTPGEESFYLVDGGVDNDYDPNERDGRLYELLITRGP